MIADTPPTHRGGIDYFTMSFLILTPLVGVVGTALYTYFNGFSLWMPMLFLGDVPRGRHLDLRRVPPLLLAQELRGARARPDLLRDLRRDGRAELDPLVVVRATASITSTSTRTGIRTTSSAASGGRTSSGSSTGTTSATTRSRTRRTCWRTRSCMWQHRWHKVILIVGGFGLPTLIGAAFGDPIAGLLWGGFLRLAVIHHTTFFVNSLAHQLGKPLFNSEVSARDNWLVALLTLGEGYHCFHHRFPADFRNGIRWYHWDPAKWLIGALESVGLASNLRTRRCRRSNRPGSPPSCALSSRRWPPCAHARRRSPPPPRRRPHASREGPRPLAPAHDERTRNAHAWRRTRSSARQHIREARARWRHARDIAAAASVRVG